MITFNLPNKQFVFLKKKKKVGFDLVSSIRKIFEKFQNS